MAAVVSWGIVLFEHVLQLSLAQLKIIQEVVTLGVFVPFALFYMHQPLKMNFVWAGLCLAGAVFFIFR